MADDRNMPERMRRQRIRIIKKLCDKVPSEHIPALENYLLELLPEQDEQHGQETIEAAREMEQLSALDALDTTGVKPS